MKIFHYIVLLIAAISCRHQHSVPNEVSDYLAETLDLLEQKSVNKNKIEWLAFKRDVLKEASNAKKIEDTYAAIIYAINKLDDNHSYFRPVTELDTASENKPLPVLADEITPKDIGYIRIPFCIGTDKEYNQYIATIRTNIAKQSQHQLKGWIVDLRGNFGGNMWPMLLAVEPLIGNGTMGYFVDADEHCEAWIIIDGKAYIDNQLILETTILSEQELSTQFLAVLTDHQTASSGGEALAVAFKLRKNTKSFGQPTFGVSTGCVSHELSDGSTINLAESIFADRGKTKFGKSIVPDFQVDEHRTLTAAIEWIHKMNTKHH